MSIIFQLFRADYLSQLDATALDVLKQAVTRHFRADEFVDTTRNTILETALVDLGLVEQAIAHIQNRAREVFRQLQPQSPPPTVLPGPFNLTQPLFPQLFSTGDLNRLPSHQRDILEMAISCEVTHFNGYVYLLTIKERADSLVMGSRPGMPRPTNPDTVYSPFNPDSPLYTLYNPRHLPETPRPRPSPDYPE